MHTCHLKAKQELVIQHSIQADMLQVVKQIHVLQFGSYLAGQGFPLGHNLTDIHAANYTFFDFTSIPYNATIDLQPVSGTCFNTESSEALSADERLVDDCAARQGTCCYDFKQNPPETVSCRALVYCTALSAQYCPADSAFAAHSFADPTLCFMRCHHANPAVN